MTDPKETNEEINEELSTEELKSVSGGMHQGAMNIQLKDAAGNTSDFKSPIGSGSGMKLEDWKKRNHAKLGPSAAYSD